MSAQNLTLLTFNLWHGLNHNYPKLMLPAETWSDKLKRDRYVLDALRKTQSAGPFIAAFQELNPVQKKLKAITNALNMNGTAAEGNVGIRVGALSYPFLLQEGLGIAWNSHIKPNPVLDPKRVVLSGECTDFKTPIVSIPVTFQLSERRIALFMSVLFGPLKIGIINTHLHHGNPKWKNSGQRRLSELEVLFKNATELFSTDHDLVFLLGDFNCYPGLPEYDFILSQDYKEISLDRDHKPFVTWDPFENPQCRQSVDLTRDPLVREWDNARNAFDHIFMKAFSEYGKSLAIKTQAERVFDKGPFWPSDHYGVQCKLEFSNL